MLFDGDFDLSYYYQQNINGGFSFISRAEQLVRKMKERKRLRLIGGVAGANQRGKVQQCFNNGTVQGSVGNYYGGLCGSVTGDGIHNSYNAGSVNGAYYIGGIAGYATGATIKNCYNRGNVNSQNTMGTNTGNFIGYVSGTCSLTNCYYDTSVENSVLTNTTYASGRDTSELTGADIVSTLGFQSGIWSGNHANAGIIGLYSSGIKKRCQARL